MRGMAGKNLLLMAMAATALVYLTAHRSAIAQSPSAYDAFLERQATEWGTAPIQYLYSDQIVPAPGEETRTNPPIPPGGFDPAFPEPGGGEVFEDSVLSYSDLYGAPIESSGTWLRNGCWYTQQEFVMLTRSEPRFISLAVDTFTGRVMTNTSAAHRFEPGTRLTLGRVLGRDQANREHALELTYFGLFDWSARSSLVSPTSGTITSLLGDTDAASPFVTSDSQSYTYTADFNSFELNMLIRSRPRRDALVLRPDGHWVRHAPTGYLKTFLFGLRAASLNEQFILSTVDGANSGTYRVTTHNDMVGIQFGGELREQFPNWSWGIRGKLGALVNLADRMSRIDTVVGGMSSSSAESLDATNLVFLADGNVYADYQIRPNLSFFVQYDILYVTGVGLAAENLGLGTSFPKFNLEGGSLMQGMSFGFYRYW